MALPNSSLQSHITKDSTSSLVRTFREIRKEERDPIDQRLPSLFEKYQSAQTDSIFASVPRDIEELILATCAQHGSSDVLLNLGLTCKYWHLRVRSFIEKSPEGAAFRRAHEYRQFVGRNGHSPVEYAKNAIRLHRGFGGVAVDASPGNAISRLRNSSEPVIVRLPQSRKWFADFGKTLAGRKYSVTLFEFYPQVVSTNFLIRAIRATPGGSYLALLPHAGTMPVERADRLAKAIKKNPVVCHVAYLEDDPVSIYLIKERDLNLLAACARNQVEGIRFRFEYGNLRKEEAKSLADVLRNFTTTVTLEIFSMKTSQDAMGVIFEAVRAHNQTSPGKIHLICDGTIIGEAVGKAQFRALEEDGIRFVNTGMMNEDSSDPNDTSDDDSDIIVRSTSSDEDSHPGNESDLEKV